jgi:hypothetical protein
MVGNLSRGVGAFCCSVVLLSLWAGPVAAQLVYNQEMTEHSAILPLTLDNNVYRVRAQPPDGVKPPDIVCDIGITGTVLTDQRGTSVSDPGEKVAGGLWNYDDIDVHFTDRVYSGYRDIAGNRLIQRYDLDCGINIKYETKKKVAQVEIRVGYVLPSGDVEGLTWAKLRRKQRQFQQNIAKCGAYRRDIGNLQAQCQHLATSWSNDTQRTVNFARISSIERQIARKQKFISQEIQFKRDLAAFASLDEYLKTKIHGTQVYVHFHHEGQTLPVDIDDLKRSRIRPLQVFEYGKDPIQQRVGG